MQDRTSQDPTHDPACDAAHGHGRPNAADGRILVAVYASPVSRHLLRWGRELGFQTVLLEPQPDRVTDEDRDTADRILDDPHAAPTGDVDVVVTDHHREELGPTLAPLVRSRPRWIGIMGTLRHAGPHGPALRDQGVDDDLIATVRRPIGLDIGSKTPPEIALATLAGLIADRNGRGGGFLGTE